MTNDVERIASELTKAERNTVINWKGNHDEVTSLTLDPLWFCIMKDGAEQFKLIPTEFGLAVRQHLLDIQK